MQHSYHSMQSQFKPLLHLPKNLWKRTQTAKKTKKSTFLITFNTPPCQLGSSNQIKRFGKTTACSTLIISYNSNISHSLTCPRTWRKGPKQLKKTLQNGQFSMILQQKTTGYKTTCRSLITSFNSNISHIPTCPNTWGNQTSKKN